MNNGIGLVLVFGLEVALSVDAVAMLGIKHMSDGLTNFLNAVHEPTAVQGIVFPGAFPRLFIVLKKIIQHIYGISIWPTGKSYLK